jgi:hypothetical protein
VTYKHNRYVKIVKKLTTLCFKSFGKAHKRRKHRFLLATPINCTHCTAGHVLSAHVHNLALLAGMVVNMLKHAAAALKHPVDANAARGVCAPRLDILTAMVNQL